MLSLSQALSCKDLAKMAKKNRTTRKDITAEAQRTQSLSTFLQSGDDD